MLEWLLGLTKGRWMGFLTRDVMLQATRWIIWSFQTKFCTKHFFLSRHNQISEIFSKIECRDCCDFVI